MSMSPSARTIQALEAKGWLVDVVERQITRKIKKDLLGFIDLLAIGPRDDDGVRDLVGIQVTSGSNHAARYKKITVDCAQNALKWIQAGARIELWSWLQRKREPKGWHPRVQFIHTDDLYI